ncbi:hypothetical protein HaLaN_15953, partial [Haematococcus lacustris]
MEGLKDSQYDRDSGITRQAQATKTWLALLKPQLKALSQLIMQAKKRWPDRVLTPAYGVAGFDGSGTVGCSGVPVKQMLQEALRQFPA